MSRFELLRKTIVGINTFLILWTTGQVVSPAVAPALNGEKLKAMRDYGRVAWSAILRGGTDSVLIAEASTRHIQLLERRSMVIDLGALDLISYFPKAGPGINEITTSLYGIDLLNPNGKNSRRDQFPWKDYKDLWENRSADEWKTLAGRYGFSDIVTPASANLRLDKIWSDDRQAIYRVF